MNAAAMVPAVSLDPKLSGRALLSGSECLCGDAIKPDDLVAANFDITQVHTGGALYLYVHMQDGRITYRGCCQMMRTPRGIAIDASGHGDWETVPELPAHMFVVGVVERVYRPT